MFTHHFAWSTQLLKRVLRKSSVLRLCVFFLYIDNFGACVLDHVYDYGAKNMYDHDLKCRTQCANTWKWLYRTTPSSLRHWRVKWKFTKSCINRESTRRRCFLFNTTIWLMGSRKQSFRNNRFLEPIKGQENEECKVDRPSFLLLCFSYYFWWKRFDLLFSLHTHVYNIRKAKTYFKRIDDDDDEMDGKRVTATHTRSGTSHPEVSTTTPSHSIKMRSTSILSLPTIERLESVISDIGSAKKFQYNCSEFED